MRQSITYEVEYENPGDVTSDGSLDATSDSDITSNSQREITSEGPDHTDDSEQVVTTADIVEWHQSLANMDPLTRSSAPDFLNRNRSLTPVRRERQPRYLSRSILGRGGMGEVRLCKDSRVGRSIAMKVLHPEARADRDAQLRFIQEAQIQGQLEHPAIPPVYDLGQLPDGTLYFTMKRLRGKTLAEILRGLREGNPSTRQQFSPHRLLGAFLTVCRAVHYAHSRGIVHRDLKPQTVPTERKGPNIDPQRCGVLAASDEGQGLAYSKGCPISQTSLMRAARQGSRMRRTQAARP